MEFTFLENALIRDIFIHAPPHSNLAPKFLSSLPMQKEITHSPGQHSFENLFPPTAERGIGNNDLLYQNSTKRYEDGLENMKMAWFFIFCMICNFFKRDGFTVL